MAKKKRPARPRTPASKLAPLRPFVERGKSAGALADDLRDEALAVRDPSVVHANSPAAADEPDQAEEFATIRKRFHAAMESRQGWRIQAETDLKWAAGLDGDRSYQWPEVVQQSRDLQQRPFLLPTQNCPYPAMQPAVHPQQSPFGP